MPLDQPWEDELAIAEPKVGRLAHRAGPGAHPSPEWQLGVSLESPLGGLSIHPPSGAVVLVVTEKPIEHVHVPEVPKRL